jgi:hypothetical protein
MVLTLSTVISIVNGSLVSLINGAMTDYADPSQTIRELGKLPTGA